MARYYRTQGIVLEKEDRGEADRVFTVFTKDFGKLRLRAVSERKITSKLRGGLELFYLAEIEFVQGKTQKTVTDAWAIDQHILLRRDVNRLRVMHRLAEIVDDLVKGQEEDQRLWSLLSETVAFLNRSGMKTREVRFVSYYFLWNLFATLGYRPSLGPIAERNEKVAAVIQTFLQSDLAALQDLSKAGIQEDLLQKICQEHLSKVQES